MQPKYDSVIRLNGQRHLFAVPGGEGGGGTNISKRCSLLISMQTITGAIARVRSTSKRVPAGYHAPSQLPRLARTHAPARQWDTGQTERGGCSTLNPRMLLRQALRTTSFADMPAERTHVPADSLPRQELGQGSFRKTFSVMISASRLC